MPRIERSWNGERDKRVIGNLLRAGVTLSAVVVLTGLAGYLGLYSGRAPHYGVFRGEPAALRSVSTVIRSALKLDSRGLIQFGLVMLMATPVARVIFSIISFALERDRMYVAITSIVLLALLYSLAGG